MPSHDAFSDPNQGIGDCIMPEINLRRAISELLADLGATSQDVATNLNTNRVQGVRNAARFLNPLVRYIQVSVQSEAIDIDVIKQDTLRILLSRGRKIEIPLPKAVREFIRDFNEGSYPEMEVDKP